MENKNYNNYLNEVGVVLSVLNLILNEEQTKANDVHKANDEQANYLLDKLEGRFSEIKQDIEDLEHYTCILSERLREQNKMLSNLVKFLEDKNV